LRAHRLPHRGMARSSKKTRVLGYVRVSTTEQAEEGVSLDAQTTKLRDYARLHDLELVDVVADNGVSAKRTTNRPGLQRALKALKRGEAAGLVVVKLDRLSRTTTDLLGLVAQADRERWQLHSIHEHLDTRTPHGRFVLTILAGLAQMEREQIAERTRDAMAELRRQGRRISGKPPFGFRFEGEKVVPVPAEQRALERIRKMHAEGMGSWRIWKRLNQRGGKNPRTGRPWSRGSVVAILRTLART
jgi:site-specific DNA recombinase